jgi:enoyl-CoA hydratase
MPVELTTLEDCALLRLNRPEALNALSFHVLKELSDALAEEATWKARALILTGAGEKAFVAGADVAGMAGMSAAEARRFAERGHAVLDRLERLPVPTVAAVNGYALGGGCEVALACDLVYASERARFGQPEVNLGIVPGFGGTQRLPRRVGPMRALEILLTGDSADAARARELGLVLEVLPPDRLLPHARQQVKKILARGPLAVGQVKRLVLAGAGMACHVAAELERQGFAALFATDDAREGMRAFLEKRPPRFRGA